MFSPALFAAPVGLSVFALAMMSSTASAAPQILAVASTDFPIPIVCEKGECSAELTAICLQEYRASPQKGQEYYVHEDRKFVITLTSISGNKIDLSNLPFKLQTARGHSALRVSFKEKQIRKLEAVAIEISVPEYISAIPMPRANDKAPQTESDILIATGPLRSVSNRLVDENTGRADAARLINQAINKLPRLGRSEPNKRKAAERYFQAVTEKSGYSDKAVKIANKAVKQCFYETQVGFISFRQCLGSTHDRVIGNLNTKFWKSLNSGS
ncbi:MAG: hypothetical protein JKY12_05885 [Sneathiella sp.]|nr:hypothetical protein [Sneathiella sp.]